MDLLQTATACIDEGRHADVPALFHSVQAQGENGLDGYLLFLKGLFEAGEWETVERIHDATLEAEPMSMASQYVLAGIRAHQGDIDDCKARLGSTLKLATRNADFLFREEKDLDRVRMIMKEFALIQPDLPALDIPATEPVDAGAPFGATGHDFFALSSCNGLYFDRFAVGFVGSLFESWPEGCCHIHVMNPTPGFEARRDALLARHPNLRMSAEPLQDEASLYACRRLQVVGPLMRHHEKSALVSDIDVVWSPRVEEFHGLERIKAGIFKVHAFDPMLIMHLSLSYFRFAPETLTVVDYIDRYITGVIRQGYYMWMLDQSSVLTVDALARQGRPPFDGPDWGGFEVADLAPVMGAALGDYQTNQDSDIQEKWSLRGFGEAPG